MKSSCKLIKVYHNLTLTIQNRSGLIHYKEIILWKKQFVNAVYQSVIEDNLSIYKGLFKNTKIQEASDPHWIKALTLFDHLCDTDKDILMDIIKQTMVDSISNIFGIIDGSSFLDESTHELKLMELNSGASLSGDLQSIFLELDEGK